MIQRITIKDKQTGQVIFEAKVLKSGVVSKTLASWIDKIDVEIRNENKQKILFILDGRE